MGGAAGSGGMGVGVACSLVAVHLGGVIVAEVGVLLLIVDVLQRDARNCIETSKCIASSGQVDPKDHACRWPGRLRLDHQKKATTGQHARTCWRIWPPHLDGLDLLLRLCSRHGCPIPP